MGDRVLIIEDEEDLVRSLAWSLRKEGFEVGTASSGLAGLEQARRDPGPDLVLLDLMLPDVPGADVCRQLRAGERTRDVPIIMVTARGEEIDRVVGFELGADDYVTKPFSVRELVLRIRAVLRRARTRGAEEPSATFGRLRIDRPGHRAWVDDEEVGLTALEFRLLVTLFERRGRVQTREVLLTDVWEMRPDLTTRTVDTHVKRLREKLGRAAAYVETVRGVGYRFTDQPPGETG